MGINIDLCDKNSRDVKITEANAKVSMNASNNQKDVDMHRDTTNLLAVIAKLIISVIQSILEKGNGGEK